MQRCLAEGVYGWSCACPRAGDDDAAAHLDDDDESEEFVNLEEEQEQEVHGSTEQEVRGSAGQERRAPNETLQLTVLKASLPTCLPIFELQFARAETALQASGIPEKARVNALKEIIKRTKATAGECLIRFAPL